MSTPIFAVTDILGEIKAFRLTRPEAQKALDDLKGRLEEPLMVCEGEFKNGVVTLTEAPELDFSDALNQAIQECELFI